MKWFRHETVAHTNLKLQNVIEVFGMEGYGYFWACLEIIGLQGENYRLKAEKNWKIYLKKQTNLTIEKQDAMLIFFAQNRLMDKKALEKGDLFFPKMTEYSDDYTKKVRRVSGQGTDNVPLHNITIHNNTIHNSKEKFGEFENVLLTLEEHQKLVEKLGAPNTELMISELDTGIASKGYKYKSHYATILNWSRRRIAEHKEKVEKTKSQVAFK